MRLWHYKLLPYLPDAQFKGQLREMVAILHDWRDKGKTNHLLINRVMEYDKRHFLGYAAKYSIEYKWRYKKAISSEIASELLDFCTISDDSPLFHAEPFPGWHNKEYLRVCMANLYEKHVFGIGKSRITEEEWQWLLTGYRDITGEDYQI